MLFPARSEVEPEGDVWLVYRHRDAVQGPAHPAHLELGEQSDGEHGQGRLRDRLGNTGPGDKVQSIDDVNIEGYLSDMNS